MKTIYKSLSGKEQILKLYDSQIEKMGKEYKDIYVDTSFGKTHLVETGNLTGKPLLVFHGGNATSACNLLICSFLLDDFHIYAVDTIGHPGKSAENCLSSNNLDYGKWTIEVIKALGFEKIACFGGSFGAGILVKAMCVAPEMIERSFLLVPSAIANSPSPKIMTMMIPMTMYWITHKREWFIKTILPMSITEDNISDYILDTAKLSIDYAKIKTQMPSNETDERLMAYKNPVYVMSAEKDCMFPGKNVIARAKKVWKQCNTYLLNDRGHMNILNDEEQHIIISFLLEN